MAIENRQLKVAKEVDDVGALLVGIVADAKAGKDIGEIASGRLNELIAAINGIDQIDDELESNRQVVLSTLGYRVGELTEELLKKKNEGGGDAGGDQKGPVV